MSHEFRPSQKCVVEHDARRADVKGILDGDAKAPKWILIKIQPVGERQTHKYSNIFKRFRHQTICTRYG